MTESTAACSQCGATTSLESETFEFGIYSTKTKSDWPSGAPPVWVFTDTHSWIPFGTATAPFCSECVDAAIAAAKAADKAEQERNKYWTRIGVICGLILFGTAVLLFSLGVSLGWWGYPLLLLFAVLLPATLGDIVTENDTTPFTSYHLYEREDVLRELAFKHLSLELWTMIKPQLPDDGADWFLGTTHLSRLPFALRKKMGLTKPGQVW